MVERLPDKFYGVGTNTFVRTEIQSASTKLHLMGMRCTITFIFRMFIFILDMYAIQEQTLRRKGHEEGLRDSGWTARKNGEDPARIRCEPDDRVAWRMRFSRVDQRTEQ